MFLLADGRTRLLSEWSGPTCVRIQYKNHVEITLEFWKKKSTIAQHRPSATFCSTLRTLPLASSYYPIHHACYHPHLHVGFCLCLRYVFHCFVFGTDYWNSRTSCQIPYRTHNADIHQTKLTNYNITH